MQAPLPMSPVPVGDTLPLLDPNPLGALLGDAAALSNDDPALHVARRLAHGPTPELIAQIQSQTPMGWIESQLHPELIDDTRAEVAVAGFTTLHLSPGMVRETGADIGTLRRELRVAALLRAVHSQRQVLEVMVEFWRSHFNVDINGYWESVAGAHYEYDVVRPNALGRFRDLLQAVAASPSMLAYLDNATSRAPDVNENYARELLELHTLGVNGGYGEADVRMAAYAFSGWGFDTESMTFVFRDNRHDPRALRVLDWTAPEGTGVDRGQSLLDHLASHPATAFHLASKLASWFIGPTASVGLVNRAAKAYLTGDTQITALLRVLLFSDEFMTANSTKLRQPFSQLAAWLRATAATTDTTTGGSAEGTRSLDWAMSGLGQQPWGWPAPNGFPDHDAYWAGSALLVARWRLSSQLTSNRVKGVSIRHGDLAGDATTVGQLVDRLGARLLSLDLSQEQRDPLVAFGGGEDVWLGDLPDHQLRELYSLVLLLPAAMRR